jgi:hypothetical protein
MGKSRTVGGYERHSLAIGEKIKVKGGFAKTLELVYAGMPSDDRYCLAIVSTYGNNQAGYNLYFPLSRTDLEFEGKRFYVERVSPEEIRLRNGV